MADATTGCEPWRPVVPGHFLRAGDNIVAGWTQGQELALWRSHGGAAQVWENRCPHRGTRFTLGRIVNDRVSCAYHGWEFSADGGQCAVIPAHPAAPAPRQMCVKTFSAQEAGGMVWVRVGASAAPMPELHALPGTFVRTLGVRSNVEMLRWGLTDLGLNETTPCVWTGQLAGEAATVFLTEASPDLCFAHIWHGSACAAGLRSALHAAGGLRADVESRMTARS